jgi:hypothetical protein
MKSIASSLALVAACLSGAGAWSQNDEPEVWARLPEAVTNNAVAGVELDGHMMAYSFAGLHAGKTWRDVTSDAYACDLDARECREIDGLPDGIGRLASVAVTVRDQIYIFGGYTVAEDGSEASTPEVWLFDPASEIYTHITDMPVPVDDTVAMAFQDRYIYLVSGWHDTDNVDLVQVYDVEDDVWFDATPFPGAPVFGHAGAMDENGQILICGGTAVIPPAEEGGRRNFAATDACWAGQIGENLTTIEWSAVAPIPGGPFYRGAMLPSGPLDNNGFVLLGGSSNAYNYNGIGYDGIAVQPRGDRLQAFGFWTGVCGRRSIEFEWPAGGMINLQAQVMDIRGTASGYMLGGMGRDQRVSDRVIAIARPDFDLIYLAPHARIPAGGCDTQ